MRRLALASTVLFGLVLASCGGGTSTQGAVVVGSAGGEVSASDGRMMLTVPPGALDGEVEVSIAAAPREEWPEDVASIDPLVVYRMEPDGLEFAEPVRFELAMDLDVSDGLIAPPVVVVRGSGREYEVVNLDVEIDLNAETAIVSGAVDHFSWIVGHDAGLTVALEEIDPLKQAVGSVWEAEVRVRNDSGTEGGGLLRIGRGLRVTEIEFAGWDTVEVVGTDSHAGFVLTDEEERDLDLPVPRWKCADPGEGRYGVFVSALLGGNLLSNFLRGSVLVFDALSVLDEGQELRRTRFNVGVRVGVECVAVPPTTTKDNTTSAEGPTTDNTTHEESPTPPPEVPLTCEGRFGDVFTLVPVACDQIAFPMEGIHLALQVGVGFGELTAAVDVSSTFPMRLGVSYEGSGFYQFGIMFIYEPEKAVLCANDSIAGIQCFGRDLQTYNTLPADEVPAIPMATRCGESGEQLEGPCLQMEGPWALSPEGGLELGGVAVTDINVQFWYSLEDSPDEELSFVTIDAVTFKDAFVDLGLDEAAEWHFVARGE